MGAVLHIRKIPKNFYGRFSNGQQFSRCAFLHIGGKSESLSMRVGHGKPPSQVSIRLEWAGCRLRPKYRPPVSTFAVVAAHSHTPLIRKLA
jgi:hypothetical protein